MKRTPFAVCRQLTLAVTWYGTEYTFYRHQLNDYKEPIEEKTAVQVVDGIYHASERSFIELINTEGTSVKSKISHGIVCSKSNDLVIQQGDYVHVGTADYYVTAVEPIMYSDEVVAYEISIEEQVEGNDKP